MEGRAAFSRVQVGFRLRHRAFKPIVVHATAGDVNIKWDFVVPQLGVTHTRAPLPLLLTVLCLCWCLPSSLPRPRHAFQSPMHAPPQAPACRQRTCSGFCSQGGAHAASCVASTAPGAQSRVGRGLPEREKAQARPQGRPRQRRQGPQGRVQQQRQFGWRLLRG
jgi:hypothetical protein